MDDHYDHEMHENEHGMINQQEIPELAQVSDRDEIHLLHETLAIGGMRQAGPRSRE